MCSECISSFAALQSCSLLPPGIQSGIRKTEKAGAKWLTSMLTVADISATGYINILNQVKIFIFQIL